MSQKTAKKVAKLIAILLVGALVITSFTFIFSFADTPDVTSYGVEERPDWDKEFSLIRELMITTRENYKDDVTYRSLIEGAYKGIIDSLKDPYSTFYNTEEESREFEESVSGEFSGVGVSLEQVGNVCKVISPISGGPAEKAGVLSGDVVVQVDGADVSTMALVEIAALLRGKEGTKVNMTVMRGSKQLTFALFREKIRLSSVDYQLIDKNIGYIKIVQFDSDSHLEFKQAKLKLLAQGAKAFIVDVRNNPGGYVGTAAAIADQMMPAGPIVHFKNRDNIVETISASGNEGPEMPIVLLINEGSASASEILAAAWQDSDTAILVGTTTYGKGVAQQVLPVGKDKKVKLSMYYFLSPKKNPINKVGIIPDYVVKNYTVHEDNIVDQLEKEYRAFAPMSEKNKPKKGDMGLNVFGAQQRLALLGYMNPISGIMDEKTVEAVKSFQKGKGLFSYGVLDYSTMTLLDRTAIEYVVGAKDKKDLQLEKAIELLKLN